MILLEICSSQDTRHGLCQEGAHAGQLAKQLSVVHLHLKFNKLELSNKY